MKSAGHSNALLVELLIVAAFFMLSATFLVQMFSAAKMQGEKAEDLNQVLVEAQNIAERLYAAPDPEEALAGMGFSGADGVWSRKTGDDLTAEVRLQTEPGSAGILNMQTVRICRDGETLIELPVARYEELPAGQGELQEVLP